MFFAATLLRRTGFRYVTNDGKIISGCRGTGCTGTGCFRRVSLIEAFHCC